MANISNIKRINSTPHEQLRFWDFQSLRSGRDTFSALKSEQLVSMVGKTVLAQIDFDDPALIDKVLRWVLRGLDVDKAVRKVKTDLEITENAITGKQSRRVKREIDLPVDEW